MAEQDEKWDVQIALLKQRVEHMEKEVQGLHSDLKELRSEMKKGFEAVLEKLDSQRDEIASTKSFGKGVYWVIGGLVTLLIAFKSYIFGGI